MSIVVFGIVGGTTICIRPFSFYVLEIKIYKQCSMINEIV